MWDFLTGKRNVVPDMGYTEALSALREAGKRLVHSGRLVGDEVALEAFLGRLGTLARSVPGAIREFRVGVMSSLWAMGIQDRQFHPRHWVDQGFNEVSDNAVYRGWRKVLGSDLHASFGGLVQTIARLHKQLFIVVGSIPPDTEALAERIVDSPINLRIASEGLRQRRGKSDISALEISTAVVRWR
jgi:hypothetical protein